MTTAQFEELRALIERHASPESQAAVLLPNLIFGVADGPTAPCQVVVEPVFSLIAQGAKRVEIGKQAFAYRAGQFLVVSVTVPLNAHVVEATPELPCLGLGMKLRAEDISNLLQESSGLVTTSEDPAGVAISDLSSDLVDAVVRLLRLLDHRSDIPILAAAIEREILWRLIKGPQGALVRQIGLTDSRTARIARSIHWLRSHLAEAVRIETLAKIAGMSVTSLHRHFRAVTSLSPIQYQKQLRLHAARARLVTTEADVAEVGFSVGYQSLSQFSREYRRMFGKSPSQDVADLKAATRLEHPQQ